MDNQNFFQQVYEVVRLIPSGRVTSYGAIAKFIGAPGSSRQVGWAMNGAGKIKPPVPAHRVVNRNGELSGRQFFTPPSLMEDLLKQEGITVVNNKIKDFKKHYWDPEELI